MRQVLLYNPVTGTLTVDANYTNPPIASEAYELHAVIDPNDLHNLINETLKICNVVHEFTIVPGFNDTRIQLNARQQVLTISGTPTAGTYTLTYGTFTTAPIAYNADPTAVQTALRLGTGLDQVVVTAPSTSPNYVHTIRLAGISDPSTAVSVDASGVTGGSFSMGAITNPQAWLTEPKWVRQIGWLTPASETRSQISPYIRVVRGDAVKYNDQVWFEHFGMAYDPGSSTMYVKVICPAYNLCATSIADWGVQNGLSAETDLAIPQEAWVAAGVRMLAWQKFNLYLAPGDKDRSEAEQRKAAAIFNSFDEQFLDIPMYTSRPIEQWGSPPMGYSGWNLG